MLLTVPAGADFTVKVTAIKDKFGNPATVDGVPEWTVSDDTKLEVTPDADGMGAKGKSLGPAGEGLQVVWTADADLGEGIKPLVGFLDVTVVGGEATTVEILGTLDETPEAPPVVNPVDE